ncbi:hypothetical protein [Bradyrhizobium cytisi]|uniref:hypothetical protein n=1 Tax=Bradyrhizobium cytisi TaxID=515489 RepID=UPI001653351B|nr:hypothetical protein [Bradyrhizobium cytisi]
MSMIASSRERRRSACPLSRRSFGFIVPSDPTEGITPRDSTESSKAKLQAFGPSKPESLQSQPPSSEKRTTDDNLGPTGSTYAGKVRAYDPFTRDSQ